MKSPRTMRRRFGEGIDYVTCRICHREFRAVAWAHLVHIHGFDPEHPILEYKQIHGLSMAASRATRYAIRSALLRRFERLGRRWSRQRVRLEIAVLRKKGAPLNAGAVHASRAVLLQNAVRFFGSWDGALASCGIRPDSVRLRRVWGRAAVLRALRRNHDGRLPINYRAVCQRDPGLASAVPGLFGSWDDALRAAGIDPARIRVVRPTWTRASVIQAIRSFGTRLSQHEIGRRDPGLLGAANRIFGGWVPALAAAGIAHPLGRRTWKWTREALLAKIRDAVRRNRRLSARSLQTVWRAAKIIYGSWHAAVKAAGCERSLWKPAQQWTRGELLGLLRRVQRKHGRVSHALLREVSRPGYVWPMVSIKRVFGTLSRAKLAARHLGVTSTRVPRRWSRPAIVHAIRREHRAGRPLHVHAVQARDPGLLLAGTQRFGSWDAALGAAGLDCRSIRRRPYWDRDRLLGELQQVLRVEPNPSCKGHRALQAAAVRLFGGWLPALRVARIEGRRRPSPRRPSSSGVLS